MPHYFIVDVEEIQLHQTIYVLLRLTFSFLQLQIIFFAYYRNKSHLTFASNKNLYF